MATHLRAFARRGRSPVGSTGRKALSRPKAAATQPPAVGGDLDPVQAFGVVRSRVSDTELPSARQPTTSASVDGVSRTFRHELVPLTTPVVSRRNSAEAQPLLGICSQPGAPLPASVTSLPSGRHVWIGASADGDARTFRHDSVPSTIAARTAGAADAARNDGSGFGAGAAAAGLAPAPRLGPALARLAAWARVLERPMPAPAPRARRCRRARAHPR